MILLGVGFSIPDNLYRAPNLFGERGRLEGRAKIKPFTTKAAAQIRIEHLNIGNGSPQERRHFFGAALGRLGGGINEHPLRLDRDCRGHRLHAGMG